MIHWPPYIMSGSSVESSIVAGISVVVGASIVVPKLAVLGTSVVTKTDGFVMLSPMRVMAALRAISLPSKIAPRLTIL